ncbi:FAD-dependent oxidoreductase [Zooshikella ganghwensis]|uniref:FAD-dependent oxidoreductase n=1 Tax=Zooshikella ganghwensis TaxID=202772 RepID=UPI00198144C5|nr:NAD(P)/FAD-dependent oxidoreductase [Zooshikella ganghwensis]
MEKIIIVGGGLSGSLAAIYLSRLGHEVHVIEKRADPLQNISDYIDKESSRAIGVSMTIRGINAVLGAEIPYSELLACGLPIYNMSFFIKGKFKARKLQPINNLSPLSLNRSAFQKLLNTYAEINNVRYHYNQRCIDINIDHGVITTKSNNDTFQTHKADVIIGADGARSKVREVMQNTIRRFEFHQTFFKHGYKTLVIPDATEFNLKRDTLYFFGMDSKGLFAGRAATIPDGSASIALCLPYKGKLSLQMNDKAIISQFFCRYLPKLSNQLKKDLISQFIDKPSNDLINVTSNTFHYKNKALLIGDSAHATAPFLGQGMNMALEDVQVLANLLQQHHNDFESTLAKFSLVRKKEADAMQHMAIVNYEVLSKSNPLFFMRVKYNRLMHNKLPTIYPPDLADKLYFSSMAYSKLRTLQQKQNVWYKLGRVS